MVAGDPTKTILVCPLCGKSGLYYEAGLITGRKYHCKHCHYIGAFVVELDIEETNND
jgi:transposase-like protein